MTTKNARDGEMDVPQGASQATDIGRPSIDINQSLPSVVTAEETLARNHALWPQARVMDGEALPTEGETIQDGDFKEGDHPRSDNGQFGSGGGGGEKPKSSGEGGKYNAEAVNKQIASSSRHGPKIGGREAKAIHALLKGRH